MPEPNCSFRNLVVTFCDEVNQSVSFRNICFSADWLVIFGKYFESMHADFCIANAI